MIATFSASTCAHLTLKPVSQHVFFGFTLVPIDDAFVLETHSGEETVLVLLCVVSVVCLFCVVCVVCVFAQYELKSHMDQKAKRKARMTFIFSTDSSHISSGLQ